MMLVVRMPRVCKAVIKAKGGYFEESQINLSTVGPYLYRCVPFQIMSNQLDLPQVDSNQVVETSQG